MGNAYNVPTHILTSQARATAKLYDEDSEENRNALAGIGIGAAEITPMLPLADEIDAIEGTQEAVKNQRLTEQNEATEAVQGVVSWRNVEVLPRAKLALKGDRRLRHFRPGKLRSVRTATVIREGRLLVDAIERFKGEPAMQKRGVNTALADKGRMLIQVAEKEDTEAAAAVAHQRDVTERVYELEDRLDDLLADIEQSAAAVFPEGSAARKRYRLNVIREYIAEMHNRPSDEILDPTAETEVPDPIPE